MRCPICAAAELAHDTRDLPYTYKGETTTIPAVVGDYCLSCGESVVDAAESARVSAAMLAFNREVNASIVDPAFIASVRKKLALDQREATEIFGGGINAFSRYENGKTKPPLALIKLFRALFPTTFRDLQWLKLPIYVWRVRTYCARSSAAPPACLEVKNQLPGYRRSEATASFRR